MPISETYKYVDDDNTQNVIRCFHPKVSNQSTSIMEIENNNGTSNTQTKNNIELYINYNCNIIEKFFYMD